MGYNSAWGEGMISQIYYNIFLQLRDWILKEISDALNKLPKTIPCKVVQNNGQTVDVLPTLNVGVTAQTMKNVPIAKSKYLNIPFKAGDLGLLVPASYLYNDLILMDMGFIQSPKLSTTLAGYIFIPMVNYANDLAGTSVNNNTKIFSQNGAADIEITNTDIKLKTNEEILWSKVKTFLDNFKIAFNNNVTTANNNYITISAALSSLGAPVSLTALSQYTGDYR